MLEIKNLKAGYSDIEVLHDVCLAVDKGEFISVIGANGAGKTTLLKAICGLVPWSDGLISFLSERIDNLPSYEIVKKGISLVPEGRRIFPRMTVLENLELGCYIKEVRKYKDELLEMVFSIFPRLRERKQQLAGTLSGGEQQMLAIGRALMTRPKLLMLDEPSLGLSPLYVERIFQVLEELKKKGLTILLVEQNVHDALAIADRAYVLENGHIVLEGSGKELIDDDRVKKAYLAI